MPARRSAADANAGMAMAATQIAAAAAALTWMVAEWIANGKPSVLGMMSGAVAGLVAITPAVRLRQSGRARCSSALPPGSSAMSPRSG